MRTAQLKSGEVIELFHRVGERPNYRPTVNPTFIPDGWYFHHAGAMLDFWGGDTPEQAIEAAEYAREHGIEAYLRKIAGG